VSGLCPDVILFDSTAPEAALALRFLQQHPDATLIGLEGDGHKAVVVSGREQAVITTHDLARVILAKAEEAHVAGLLGMMPVPSFE
jgi:hypothetical protein